MRGKAERRTWGQPGMKIWGEDRAARETGRVAQSQSEGLSYQQGIPSEEIPGFFQAGAKKLNHMMTIDNF